MRKTRTHSAKLSLLQPLPEARNQHGNISRMSAVSCKLYAQVHPLSKKFNITIIGMIGDKELDIMLNSRSSVSLITLIRMHKVVKVQPPQNL